MKGRKTGGRTKGVPNKLTASAKEAVDLAFQGIGGISTLKAWAEDNKEAFFTKVWAKVIPLTVAGDKDNPLEVIHRVKADLGTKLDRLSREEK